MEIGAVIGTGSQGLVYKGHYNGTEVAIKTLFSLPSANDQDIDEEQINEKYAQTASEAEALSRLHHVNMMRFFGLCHCLAHVSSYFCSEWISHASVWPTLRAKLLCRNLLPREVAHHCNGNRTLRIGPANVAIEARRVKCERVAPRLHTWCDCQVMPFHNCVCVRFRYTAECRQMVYNSANSKRSCLSSRGCSYRSSRSQAFKHSSDSRFYCQAV